MAAMNSSVLACSYARTGSSDLNAKLTSMPSIASPNVSGYKLPMIKAQHARVTESFSVVRLLLLPIPLPMLESLMNTLKGDKALQVVWDDKFIAGLGDQNQNQETKGNQNQHQNERVEIRGSITTLERSRSTGAQPYRTVNVAPPPMDPPSPKLPTCGFCALFGTPNPK